MIVAPLSSQAVDLLLRLAAQGVEFRRAGDDLFFRPADAIPGDLLPQIRAAKPTLLELLDDEVQARLDAFRRDLAKTPPPRTPAFVFRRGVPYDVGVCFSCGDGLPEARFGRCWRCSLAWRLAAQVPTTYAMLDEARLI